MPGRFIAAGLYSEVVVNRGSIMHSFSNEKHVQCIYTCTCRSFSTGEAMAVSVAATFTISIAIGLLLGMSLIMHYVLQE